MTILQSSTAFVMRELVKTALQTVGGAAGDAASQSVLNFLGRHFTDHSQRLTVAFRTSNDRAWRALEIALQGESWWAKLRGQLTPAEDRALGQQIKRYVEQIRLEGNKIDPAKVLEQISDARKKGLLEQGTLTPADLARQASQFCDPAAQLDAERRAAASIADELRGPYPHLAAFLTIQSRDGEGLLALAVRYFFRRAVEEDPQLAAGLTFAKFERLESQQEEAFAGLHQALSEQGERLCGLLGDIRETVTATHDTVLDIREELTRQSAQNQQFYRAVMQLLEKNQVSQAEARPSDSLSIQSGDERRLVKQLVAQYRALPPEQRSQMPALLNGIGKLELAVGDSQGAAVAFQEVATLAQAPSAKAEAHHNAYLAALLRRDHEGALRELKAAVRADPARFEPFPMDKYHPQRILGAGGFGVAFLCDHALAGRRVVVKTLAEADDQAEVETIFREAQAISQLNHPAIIRVQDCDYVRAQGRRRPYIVMDYFEGNTLEEVARGALDGQDLRLIFELIAEGLLAAHEHKIFHRDVKPANILVRRTTDRWEVKIIDFGLAVRKGSTAIGGGGIAGTLDYAAPEQLGRFPGIPVKAYSDVYGFGRTCCYALFGTLHPLPMHWKTLSSRNFQQLLSSCLQEHPEKRPPSFKEVLAGLKSVRAVFKPGKHGWHPDGDPDTVAPVAHADAVTQAERLRAEPTVVDTAFRQLPSHLVRPEFGEVNYCQGPAGVSVVLTMNPTMEGAKTEGWQTGVALDASSSMRAVYGRILVGKVPPEVMADYERRGLVRESVVDGTRTKALSPEAHADATRRGLLRFSENTVQPLARDFVSMLAERLDEDGATTVIYWACGDGGEIEVLGDFTAEQCRALELKGPARFGKGTRLLPAMRYFVDRFKDADKGFYVFLADGDLEDLTEVKRYTTELARAIEAGERNFVKCVLVGLGDQFNEAPMQELDDLDTGTSVDIWDHKIAREMRGITDVFAELMDENTVIAPWAKVYAPSGHLVKKFARGVPPRLEFVLPLGSAGFVLELPAGRIEQSLTGR